MSWLGRGGDRMLAKHVEQSELEEAARLTGVVIHNLRYWAPRNYGDEYGRKPGQHGNRKGGNWRFRLGLAADKRWQRIRNESVRFGVMRKDGQPCRVGTVCWHGHRQFFRNLFDIAPDCKVQTTGTRQFSFRWYTSNNFEDTHEGVNQFNCDKDACLCGTALQQVIQAVEPLHSVQP